MAVQTISFDGASAKSEKSIFDRLMKKLSTWQERRRTRNHLSELPEYLLRDIGLDKHECIKECNKPFWRG